MTAAPSSLDLFRRACVLACLALGFDKLMWLWFYGAAALPLLHAPLVDTVMALDAGSGGHHEGIFSTVLVMHAFSYCLFAAALYVLTAPSARAPSRGHAVLMAAQLALALFTDEKLLFLLGAEFALVLHRRPALAWLAVQMALTAVMLLFRPFYSQGQPLICTLDGSDIPPFSTTRYLVQVSLDLALHLACQALAFGIGYLGAAAQRRRAQVAVRRLQVSL